MRNPYNQLFGFRREFDEMFNRIFAGRPWNEWDELPGVHCAEARYIYPVSISLHTK
jgi:hypothetical protein